MFCLMESHSHLFKKHLCVEGLDQGLDFEAALSDSRLPKWRSGPQVGQGVREHEHVHKAKASPKASVWQL